MPLSQELIIHLLHISPSILFHVTNMACEGPLSEMKMLWNMSSRKHMLFYAPMQLHSVPIKRIFFIMSVLVLFLHTQH